MTALPTPATLAKLVSGVTETMFGMSFDLTADDGVPPWQDKLAWRTVMLAISGQQPVTVVIASDPHGGKLLAREMFSCPPEEVDLTMIDDSLSELVNIIAGQVKGVMGLDQSLGLPKVCESPAGDATKWHMATMKNKGSDVMIWVALIDRAA